MNEVFYTGLFLVLIAFITLIFGADEYIKGVLFGAGFAYLGMSISNKQDKKTIIERR